MVRKKTILVGEVGLAHEGSLGLALSMVKACKKANLDYVKFQLHNSDYESTKDEVFRVRVFPQDFSRRDYWKRTSFNLDQWREIIDYCKIIEIGFLCTPFSVWAAETLLSLGVREAKVASGDSNNWELLAYLKLHFKKVIVSTGMSTIDEVKKLCEFMEDFQGEFIVLQCTSSYPVTPNKVGLKFLSELSSLVPNVGLSDHTGNPLVAIAAVSCNASLVEFHVVFSKDQFGPDSTSSMTFDDAFLISNFRDLWIDLFDPNYDKDGLASELQGNRNLFGRGLALKNSLSKGQIVSEGMFTMKKPVGPLTWEDRLVLIGKRAIRNIHNDEHITSVDFE